MTRRGWDSQDIIRNAFITPAGNCFLRTHKKGIDCFLECLITLQVPLTNHKELGSPALSLAVFISMMHPTAPCPWGTWEQWQEKWDPIERDLWAWEANACSGSLAPALRAALWTAGTWAICKVEKKRKTGNEVNVVFQVWDSGSTLVVTQCIKIPLFWITVTANDAFLDLAGKGLKAFP